eukprot:tig00000692_g3209.t1
MGQAESHPSIVAAKSATAAPAASQQAHHGHTHGTKTVEHTATHPPAEAHASGAVLRASHVQHRVERVDVAKAAHAVKVASEPEAASKISVVKTEQHLDPTTIAAKAGAKVISALPDKAPSHAAKAVVVTHKAPAAASDAHAKAAAPSSQADALAKLLSKFAVAPPGHDVHLSCVARYTAEGKGKAAQVHHLRAHIKGAHGKHAEKHSAPAKHADAHQGAQISAHHAPVADHIASAFKAAIASTEHVHKYQVEEAAGEVAEEAGAEDAGEALADAEGHEGLADVDGTLDLAAAGLDDGSYP